MKSDANPMQRAHASPRCTARAKRTGFLCKNPAVRGWSVCRMHGAGGGHPPGRDHPSYQHGLRTRRMQQIKRLTSMLCSKARDY